MTMRTDTTSGLPGLDRVLKGVMPGDNIVWQVEAIADYRDLVVPYAEAALRAHQRLIYFRFASHEQLLPDDFGAEIHHPDPTAGFEAFATEVHRIIEEAGRGAIYVFDCLSDLAGAWSADQSLGNFFILTCPRLYDLETVTYFALYRNYHAAYAIDPITETTQFLLDVFRHEGRLYIRPIKVQHRSSSSMNTIHLWEGEEFKPINSSALISDILASAKWPGLHVDTRQGFWQRTFDGAQRVQEDFDAGRSAAIQERAMFDQLCRMVLSRDDAMIRLIGRYLTLKDILKVRARMVGIGLIGGKAVGMLLARAILARNAPKLAALFETHDSFYIGSDVFCSFLVRNGVWWIRQKQRDPNTFLDGLKEAQALILHGQFPDYTLRQFREMLDYFGESPYIVRSSSLLEDNYGNAFAGKYASVFCVNQGTRESRLQTLLDTVRRVYASAMSEEALRYRLRRGLLDRDEQMALLVMRVSGSTHGQAFYPQMAGVGFSYNPYVWNKAIDPRAGVLRLVFGLGTRAVDRSDDDYTRVVALNVPDKRPEANFDEVCEFSQRRVDYLDLGANRLSSRYFVDLLDSAADLPLEMFATQDTGSPEDGGKGTWALTFDKLLSQTEFVRDMREMLRVLEAAYSHPVDIEFAANFVDDKTYRINLLQCRPLQVRGMERVNLPAIEVAPADRLLEARGAVIGQSRLLALDQAVYVVPSRYGQLTISQRYEIARLIGRINHAAGAGSRNLMLLGPGRWGTSSPELGIPVHFAEINRVTVLCEIVAMRDNLIPDVSLGTHFLNELVEMDILYLALFPTHAENMLDETFFLEQPNRLETLVPGSGMWAETVRVIDLPEATAPRRVFVQADALEQRVLMHWAPSDLLSAVYE
jgi:hypothetical protein